MAGGAGCLVVGGVVRFVFGLLMFVLLTGLLAWV